MYTFKNIFLAVVISYSFYALDIITLLRVACEASVISEMKHKHLKTTASASTVDGSNTTKHINNVLNDDLHLNHTDYCQSSDASDSRCSTHRNWKNKSELHLFQDIDDWIKMIKNTETKEFSV